MQSLSIQKHQSICTEVTFYVRKTNSKEQFSSSPDLMPKQLDAVITSLDAHQAMSSQVVNDVSLQKRMLELLLGNLNLYEELKSRAEGKS